MVVVLVDCVALCAITGKDKTSTTSAPRTTISSFFDFIRFSSISLVTPDGMASGTSESEHNCSLADGTAALVTGAGEAFCHRRRLRTGRCSVQLQLTDMEGAIKEREFQPSHAA